MSAQIIPSVAEAARVAAPTPEARGLFGEAAASSSVASPNKALAEAIAIERAGVIAFSKEFQAGVRAMVGRGRLPKEDGELICRQIEIFAEGVGFGQHLSAIDAPGIAKAVRAAVEALPK